MPIWCWVTVNLVSIWDEGKPLRALSRIRISDFAWRGFWQAGERRSTVIGLLAAVEVLALVDRTRKSQGSRLGRRAAGVASGAGKDISGLMEDGRVHKVEGLILWVTEFSPQYSPDTTPPPKPLYNVPSIATFLQPLTTGGYEGGGLAGVRVGIIIFWTFSVFSFLW